MIQGDDSSGCGDCSTSVCGSIGGLYAAFVICLAGSVPLGAYRCANDRSCVRECWFLFRNALVTLCFRSALPTTAIRTEGEQFSPIGGISVCARA